MIIQSYNTNFSGGLGDFLRGSIFLYRIYGKNRNFFVDFKHHPISFWIKNKNESKEYYPQNKILNLDMSLDINEVRNKINKLEKEKTHYLCSYYFALFEDEKNKAKIKKITLSKQEKAFFKNCFGFDKIKEEFNLFLESNKLNEYEVVHFRLGDIELLKNESEKTKKNIYNKKQYEYESLYNKLSPHKKIVLISDSNDFKKFVINKNNKNIIVSNTNSYHTVSRPGRLIFYKENIKINNMMDLALDLNILSNAKKVESFSTNWWGSGFSFWICKIFDIPIKNNFL